MDATGRHNLVTSSLRSNDEPPNFHLHFEIDRGSTFTTFAVYLYKMVPETEYRYIGTLLMYHVVLVSPNLFD